MDWSDELILRFLNLYKSLSYIWDPTHAWHKHRPKIKEGWDKIKDDMGVPCTVEELKRKKESLMAMYRFSRKRMAKYDEEDYTPSWCGFELMDSFLANIYKVNLTCDPAASSEDEQTYTEIQDFDHEIIIEKLEDLEADSELDTPEPQHPPLLQMKRSQAPRRRRRSFKCDIPLVPQETSKKRFRHLPDLQEAASKIDQAVSILNSVSQPDTKVEVYDDECIIFGRLVTSKLRKLSDERRDAMMVAINQLFYDESHSRAVGKLEPL